MPTVGGRLGRRFQSEVIGEPFLIYDSEAGSASELDPGPDKRTHTRWDRVLKRL